jgi:hypothetical protein
VHIGVFHYLAAMEISTIVNGNVDMYGASISEYSCDLTKCALFVAIDRELRCIIAVYVLMERK